MKRWGIITVGVLAIAGAVLVWTRQRSAERAHQRQAASLQNEVQALRSALAENATAPTERKATVEPKPPVAPEAKGERRVAAAAPTSMSMQSTSNAAMLQDPETRALVRKQQEVAVRKGTERLVDKKFIRDWNLSATDAERVKELFREKALSAQSVINAMMFDGLDDAALAEQGRVAKQRIEETDEALRAVLGVDGFEGLKLQEQTIEHRERLRRIREEMASAEIPLSKAQQDALLEAMTAERQAFSYRVDISDPSKIDYENLREFFSIRNIDTFLEDMQQLGDRVAERASLFLSAEQGSHLRTLQQQHIDQARLAMKMTTELFNKPGRN